MSFLNGPTINLKDAFTDSIIDPKLRTHLQKVYSTLAMTLIAAAVGAAVHLQYNLGGILSSIASVLLLVWLGIDRHGSNEKRLGILALLGLFQGCSVGPLIATAIVVDPSLILSALSGTSTIFVCFTIAAFMVERRHALMLGAVLGSAFSIMMLLSVFNMFFRIRLVHSVNLYLGLAIFVAYIIVDTQAIIQKAKSGSDDYIMHAAELFLDFVAIFVRILIILLDKQGEDDRKKRTKAKD